jgi:hypothetical protein
LEDVKIAIKLKNMKLIFFNKCLFTNIIRKPTEQAAAYDVFPICPSFPRCYPELQQGNHVQAYPRD